MANKGDAGEVRAWVRWCRAPDLRRLSPSEGPSRPRRSFLVCRACAVQYRRYSAAGGAGGADCCFFLMLLLARLLSGALCSLGHVENH